MKKPRTETTRVTPRMAAQWLEKNTHNRPIKQRVVEDYAQQMKEGKWVLNGEAIVFDENDVLADGQHRLWACVEADTPFETVVVFGVSEAAFATIDTGVKRTAADVLHIAGHTKHRGPVAAASTLVIQYQRKTLSKKEPVSRQDILSFVEKNPEIEEWMAKAKRTRGWHTAYAAPLTALLFLGSRKYPSKADEFLDGFVTGMNLTKGSPILALRNRVASEKNMKSDTRFGLFVLAWNAHAQNRDLNKMQSPRADEFPKIVGA